MKAEIISIGTSLLNGQTINSNAAFLARDLTSLGITITQTRMIPDSSDKLIEAIQEAEKEAELLIFTGGLGPDENDIVKTTLAAYLDKPLVLDEETQNRIITYHQNSDLIMPANNQLQALTLLDSIPLVNVTGLALGMYYQSKDHTYILLPGPKDELEPMYIENTRELIIEKLLNNLSISTRIIRLYGLTLAQAHRDLAGILTADTNPFIQLFQNGLEIEVQITARSESEEETHQLLAKAEKAVEDQVEKYIIGYGTDNLPNIVRQLLKEKSLKITGAESLTGGAFLSEISSLFEAGMIFEGGMVTYSETVKQEALGVSEKIIQEFGVVSAECAFEMAEKALELFKADLAVSLTGAAGPSSLEGEIPGTVWIGIARRDQSTFAKKFHFGYKRNQNRQHSVWSAFNLVRQVLLDETLEDVVYKQ